MGPDVLVMSLTSDFVVHPPLWFQTNKILYPQLGILESIREKQGSIFKSCVCREVSCDTSHHPFKRGMTTYFSPYMYKSPFISIHTFIHLYSMELYLDGCNHAYNYNCALYLKDSVML